MPTALFQKEILMANIVILGVYTTKAALDTAEKATANNGDTYIVGSKIPYDLYTYNSTKTEFVKGDKVSNKASDMSTPVSIDDVTADIPISKLYTVTFKADDGKNLKVRKGLHLGEIHLYVPEA